MQGLLAKHLSTAIMQTICRGGGIGRRAGFKIRWWQHRAGSIPALGTNLHCKLSMMALTSVTKNWFKTAIFLASLRYMLETIGIEQDPSPIYGIITVNSVPPLFQF
jgi:hypothetical protein